MAEENRSWGYDRIVGALANLGHEGSSGDSRVTVFLRCNYKLLIINAKLVCSPSLDPGAPQSGIGQAHVADQLANFERHLWSAAATSRFPSPEQAKPSTMPTDDGLWFHDRQGVHNARRNPI